MSYHSSIQYNPRTYSNMIYIPPYPYTLAFDKRLDRFDYRSLITDTSDLQPVGLEFDIEPAGKVDNKNHDIDPTNLFYFHEPDNNSEGKLYYDGFPSDFPSEDMFMHFGGQLFTSPQNYQYINRDGHTGTHNYIVSYAPKDSPPSLIDPNIKNINRFDAVYGIEDRTDPTRKRDSWPFDSSKYDDFTGTLTGEFMHWMEVFAKQSAMIPQIPYIQIPASDIGTNPSGAEVIFGTASRTPPLVSVFDTNYGSLANSNVWRTYVDKHIMGEHGGVHDTTTPLIYSV